MGGMPRDGRQSQKTDARVPRARRLRRAMADAERKLWWHLRELPVGGTHFGRQATIGPYFADFACHHCKLVIVIDGGQHAVAGHATADAERTRFLESRGYRVLRFWNNDVLQNTEGVMTTIHDAMTFENRVAPHP